jgi:hypothetical protein
MCATSHASSAEPVSRTRSRKVGLDRLDLTIPRHKKYKIEVCNRKHQHPQQTDTTEEFRSIENKKFPMMTKKNMPRSDLRDAKQWAKEIRSTYPCRSHSGNIQMNVVGVVVLASPPRDPIRSKRHNGRHLRALHTYSAATTPPPWSSKVWWSGRWDQ